MSRTSLPQDIILLICKELAWQRDFSTLFNCSLVSTRVARLALEQLYSYGSLLEDIWNIKAADFLEPREDMEPFIALQGNQIGWDKFAKSGIMPPFEFQRSIIDSGESLINYIKQAAEETSIAVKLVHLEASFLPEDLLPTWIARIPSLESLQLQSATALTAEAASAIAKWCPKFSELRSLTCRGDNVDANLASFLRTLPPNSLQCFEIISINDIGEQTLAALNMHARSLKTLTLGSLPGHVMSSLGAISSCTAIENLSLENQRHIPWNLAGDEALLERITAWLGSCKNLRTLKLSNIGDGLLIIKDVLALPNVRLLSLDFQGFSSLGNEVDAAAWSALGQQEALEELTLGGLDGIPDALIVHETPILPDSICRLTNLKRLDLKRASLRAIELRRIVTALSQLTELGFGGDWIDDQILESIGTLQYLKKFLVNALSIFTFDSVQSFAKKLDPEHHKGIEVEINNQIGSYKFAQDQEAWLVDFFATELEGRIDIGVFKDPDEAHEDDFTSDSE
ncbi:hypothetical protein LQW54_007345 [Pestalotiopsis sp. IQ-011]